MILLRPQNRENLRVFIKRKKDSQLHLKKWMFTKYSTNEKKIMLEKQRGTLSKKMKGSAMLWKARHLPVLTSLLSFRINQKNHSSLPVFSVKRNFVNLENKNLYWTKEWRGLKKPFLCMLCFRRSIKGERHPRNVLDEPSLWKKAQEAGTGGPKVSHSSFNQDCYHPRAQTHSIRWTP